MTFYLAVWGAVLATVSLAWNFWKWRLDSPRVVETIEAVKSLWSENAYAGIRLTLRNRGGKKTTVEEIFFYRRPHWLEHGFYSVLCRLRREADWQQNVGNSSPETVKLPVILDVNGVWEGFIPLELDDPDNEKELRQLDRNREILKTLKSGNLRYSIKCSHTNSRIRGRVGDEDDMIKE